MAWAKRADFFFLLRDADGRVGAVGARLWDEQSVA